MKAIVTSKGQVTIPVLIRNRAKIAPGSQLDFQIEEDGSLSVRLLIQDISQLKGMVKSTRRKPVSLPEMKKAIRNSAQRSMS